MEAIDLSLYAFSDSQASKAGRPRISIDVQEEGYVTADVADAKGLHQLKLSGTKFRQLLRSGADIPDWFAFKSVVDVLREANKE